MIESLRLGDVTILGRHPQASNMALVVECTLDDRTARALYKPASGERPLWDFPGAVLGRREVAAFEFAIALGFDFVPPTIWRDDLPLGPGSLQLWIEDASTSDVDVFATVPSGWLPVLEATTEDGGRVHVAHCDDPDLRALAFLDVLMNNADRKAGHLLRDARGSLHAVDHGVTFHVEPKLRTVLWGFASQPIDSELLQRADPAVVELPALQGSLTSEELSALASRIETLRTEQVYPMPSPDWPAIPWPIF